MDGYFLIGGSFWVHPQSGLGIRERNRLGLGNREVAYMFGWAEYLQDTYGGRWLAYVGNLGAE